MNHSTSFRATGSPIVFCTAVASLVLALRARSIASFTAARSPESGGAASALEDGASLDLVDMLCMRSFLERRMAVMPRSARLMRFLAVLMLVAGACYGVSRAYGEHSQG